MRRYGAWNGNPHGNPEDPARCIVEVWDPSGWHSYQCCRKRGHGPGEDYCKQHGRMAEKGVHLHVPAGAALEGQT